MNDHTFVICAYKKSPYLEECILSCKAQSTVKNGQSKIILYTSTPNESIDQLCVQYNIAQFQGLGGSIGKDWNGALSAVSTRYATIVHQDDVYLPSYGEKVLKRFSKDLAATIVYTDYAEIDGNSGLRPRGINLKIKTFGLKLMSLFKSKAIQRRIYGFGNFICCPAVSYDMKNLNGFSFDENMRMAVDWDAWERIMRLPGPIVYIPENLMYHRIHSESETTVNTVNKQREVEELTMFQRYWPAWFARLLMRFYTKNQKSNE